MIKAGKFNVAPGHLFSGSKGNAIAGSRCRNPDALCSARRCLAHSPSSVMVAARGSLTHTAVRKSQRECLAAEARTGHGVLRPK